MRPIALACLPLLLLVAAAPDESANWPQFRGPFASGVSTGRPTPVEWNVETGKNVRWKTPIPGLGHSAPVVWGDRVFVTTAVAPAGHEQALKPGLYGNPIPDFDDAPLKWNVICLARDSGKVLWERTAHEGVPKRRRHPKATHANPTPAADEKRVVVSFGSEGLYCYDHDGKLLWQKDLGVLNAGAFETAMLPWGYASSPVLYDGKVVVQADVHGDSFLALFDAADGGKELWRTTRKDYPTWCTPTLHRYAPTGGVQIICNGFKEIAGYDFATGKQLWKLNAPAGDVPVPTPVVSHSLIYLTSAHGPYSPIHAVKNDIAGEFTLPQGQSSGGPVVWSIPRGGNYMQTPIVVGDYLYGCRDNGIVTCFDAKTGKEVYRTPRLEGVGFTASAVACGDRLYFTSEDGQVQVVQAGPAFKLLATNTLGANCLATPAISDGVIFFRTQKELVAVGEPR
jgi:outer membrane protein assembly factor BamB